MTANSKLSNSDSRTIRHACEAIALIIDGAMRRLETQYGPNDNTDRSLAQDSLLLHARESLGEWNTTFEMGDIESERDNNETSLVD